jgi:hypothetical protein
MGVLKRLARRFLPKAMLDRIDAVRTYLSLPPLAKEFHKLDRRSFPPDGPDLGTALAATRDWLCRAQDHSTTQDSGFARHFSLITGWSASYPETTGYIIPTFLEESARTGDSDLAHRARRATDWLLSIQLDEGAFQGGTVDQTPRVPVTFNTGQILLGLAHAAREFREEKYLDGMHRAARWLVDNQDPDGCWRRHPSPFAAQGEKTYETHVAWGLFEADRTAPDLGYADAGISQVEWALTKQRENGWFEDCCLSSPQAPLTHTLGYALRGVLEAYRLTGQARFLDAGLRTARGLLSCLDKAGRLPGRLDSAWRGTVNWVCLTGNAQIAHCFLLIHEWTGDRNFLGAGLKANAFVRRTVVTQGPPGVVGGIRGSYPVSGDYGYFEMLNWAAKFFVDASRLEATLTS